MTFTGRRIAFFIAIAIVLFLPKRIELGRHDYCVRYKLEPLSVYGLEQITGKDLGIAYTHGDDCH